MTAFSLLAQHPLVVLVIVVAGCIVTILAFGELLARIERRQQETGPTAQRLRQLGEWCDEHEARQP